jgi:hypothetical protein
MPWLLGIIGEPMQVPPSSWLGWSAHSRRQDHQRTTSAMMTKAVSLGFACLSDSDRRELVDQCFEAMERLLAHKHFGPIFHYVLNRPYWEYGVADRPQDIWAWDIKAWSHFGAITGLGVDYDPGNPVYACGVIVLCRAFGDIPSSWRNMLKAYVDFSPEDVATFSEKKLLGFYEFAGDVLEAVGGLVTWNSVQPREFCKGQGITEDDAKEVLDLLSRWMSKVTRFSEYHASLDPNTNILAIWIKESAVRPKTFDFVERVLNQQIWLSRITRSTSSNSSDSTHVALECTIASARLPRKPAHRPAGDCRFTTRKQDRIYICDWCNTRVEFNTKVQPFLGAYVRKTWSCYVSEEEQLWKDGKIDATFYCLACLAWYHNVDENVASERYLRNETGYRQSRTENWRSS